jgi:hypothetical protein
MAVDGEVPQTQEHDDEGAGTSQEESALPHLRIGRFGNGLIDGLTEGQTGLIDGLPGGEAEEDASRRDAGIVDCLQEWFDNSSPFVTLAITIIRYLVNTSMNIGQKIGWPDWLLDAAEQVSNFELNLLESLPIPSVPDFDCRASCALGFTITTLFVVLYKHFRFSGAFPAINTFLHLLPAIAMFLFAESISGLAFSSGEVAWYIAFLAISMLLDGGLIVVAVRAKVEPALRKFSLNIEVDKVENETGEGSAQVHTVAGDELPEASGELAEDEPAQVDTIGNDEIFADSSDGRVGNEEVPVEKNEFGEGEASPIPAQGNEKLQMGEYTEKELEYGIVELCHLAVFRRLPCLREFSINDSTWLLDHDNVFYHGFSMIWDVGLVIVLVWFGWHLPLVLQGPAMFGAILCGACAIVHLCAVFPAWYWRGLKTDKVLRDFLARNGVRLLFIWVSLFWISGIESSIDVVQELAGGCGSGRFLRPVDINVTGWHWAWDRGRECTECSGTCSRFCGAAHGHELAPVIPTLIFQIVLAVVVPALAFLAAWGVKDQIQEACEVQLTDSNFVEDRVESFQEALKDCDDALLRFVRPLHFRRLWWFSAQLAGQLVFLVLTRVADTERRGSEFGPLIWNVLTIAALIRLNPFWELKNEVAEVVLEVANLVRSTVRVVEVRTGNPINPAVSEAIAIVLVAAPVVVLVVFLIVGCVQESERCRWGEWFWPAELRQPSISVGDWLGTKFHPPARCELRALVRKGGSLGEAAVIAELAPAARVYTSRILEGRGVTWDQAKEIGRLLDGEKGRATESRRLFAEMLKDPPAAIRPHARDVVELALVAKYRTDGTSGSSLLLPCLEELLGDEFVRSLPFALSDLAELARNGGYDAMAHPEQIVARPREFYEGGPAKGLTPAQIARVLWAPAVLGDYAEGRPLLSDLLGPDAWDLFRRFDEITQDWVCRALRQPEFTRVDPSRLVSTLSRRSDGGVTIESIEMVCRCLIDPMFSECPSSFPFNSMADREHAATVLRRLGQPAGPEEWEIVEHVLKMGKEERDGVLDLMTARSPWPAEDCDIPAGFARWRLASLLRTGMNAVIDVDMLAKIAMVRQGDWGDFVRLAVICDAGMLEDVLQLATHAPALLCDVAAMRWLANERVTVRTLTESVAREIQAWSEWGYSTVVELLTGAQDAGGVTPEGGCGLSREILSICGRTASPTSCAGRKFWVTTLSRSCAGSNSSTMSRLRSSRKSLWR